MLFNKKLHTRYITLEKKNSLSCAACSFFILLIHYSCWPKFVKLQIRVHLKHIGYPIANDDLYLSGDFCPRSSMGIRAASLACSSSLSDHDGGAEADAEFDVDAMCTNCPNLAPIG